MAGKIRTREKCPQCGKTFSIIEEVDIHCPLCNTRPKTFFIFLYWQHEKYRIARDTDGHILDSYRRAHRLLENIRRDIDTGIFSISDYLYRELEAFRVNNLFQAWYDSKISQGLAPSHLKKIKGFIETQYKPFFGNMDCRDIRSRHVEDFLVWLPGKLSLKTKKNILTMLKNFCYWLFRRELLGRMPSFPVLSPEEKPIRWISKEEQLRVLDHIPSYHRPIFEFLVYHPVRPSEARALKVKDFDLQNMVVCISKTFSEKEIRVRKGKKPYYLPISRKFNVSVLKGKLPEAFVFTNQWGRPFQEEALRRTWHRARTKADIPHITLYCGCRHSTASQAVNAGIDLSAVSKALGHSTLEMTKKYASLEVQRLRSIVDGAQMVQIEELRQRKETEK